MDSTELSLYIEKEMTKVPGFLICSFGKNRIPQYRIESQVRAGFVIPESYIQVFGHDKKKLLTTLPKVKPGRGANSISVTWSLSYQNSEGEWENFQEFHAVSSSKAKSYDFHDFILKKSGKAQLKISVDGFDVSSVYDFEVLPGEPCSLFISPSETKLFSDLTLDPPVAIGFMDDYKNKLDSCTIKNKSIRFECPTLSFLSAVFDHKLISFTRFKFASIRITNLPYGSHTAQIGIEGMKSISLGIILEESVPTQMKLIDPAESSLSCTNNSALPNFTMQLMDERDFPAKSPKRSTVLEVYLFQTRLAVTQFNSSGEASFENILISLPSEMFSGKEVVQSHLKFVIRRNKSFLDIEEVTIPLSVHPRSTPVAVSFAAKSIGVKLSENESTTTIEAPVGMKIDLEIILLKENGQPFEPHEDSCVTWYLEGYDGLSTPKPFVIHSVYPFQIPKSTKQLLLHELFVVLGDGDQLKRHLKIIPRPGKFLFSNFLNFEVLPS